ncbi:hypothetical protein B4135_1092 [Caldibacillus debilis]|uniref:Uncharacterized protein n=1 Tax=Caldibacillus debilis TaxID=301148 RepID=A0A150ME99_9BACI|nr:hypothetical protein B4135_1092 [Caldibacillus debilis]
MNVSSQENDRIFGIELFHDLAKKCKSFPVKDEYTLIRQIRICSVCGFHPPIPKI